MTRATRARRRHPLAPCRRRCVNGFRLGVVGQDWHELPVCVVVIAKARTMVALTEYEAYSLDVSGYIVLRGVLTEAELTAVRTDGAALAALGTSHSLSMLNWVIVMCAIFTAGDCYRMIRWSRYASDFGTLCEYCHDAGQSGAREKRRTTNTVQG